MEVRLVILSPSRSHRTPTKRLSLLAGRSEEAQWRISQDGVNRRDGEFVGCDDEGTLDDFFKGLS